MREKPLDIKKRIRDRKNKLDRDKERLRKEQEKETAKEKNDIQAKHAQADILEKFIKDTVKPCFEEVKKNIDETDSPCNIDPFSDKKTGRLCAIQISFSLANYDKSFYLKYEGKAGSDEIKKEICLGDTSSLSRHGFGIDYLSRERIKKHIEDFIKAALPE